MKRTTVVPVIAAMLIFLYSYTGLSKLAHPDVFVRTIRESPLIHQGADTLAYVIPITELVIVLLLFFERSRRAGFAFSFLLLLLFTLYLAYMIVYAPSLPCSCGGVIAQMSWMQHVWFNLFFMGVSATGFLFLKHQRLT